MRFGIIKIDLIIKLEEFNLVILKIITVNFLISILKMPRKR
jgi:hypothetical protein